MLSRGRQDPTVPVLGGMEIDEGVSRAEWGTCGAEGALVRAKLGPLFEGAVMRTA